MPATKKRAAPAKRAKTTTKATAKRAKTTKKPSQKKPSSKKTSSKKTAVENEGGRSFAGRVAIVTGGAGGIARGIVERLQSQGATVVIMDMKGKILDEAAKTLGVVAHGGNITDAKYVESVAKDTLKRYKRIDIVVQCAGITGKTGVKSHEVDLDNFQLVMDVNVKGIFLVCQAVLPTMLKQNYGRIVNIASISGKEGNAGMLAYSTSKAAVIGLTKVMGKEYAETGITVNAIAPAVVRTPMVAALPPQQVKYMTDKIPMKRCGKISEIAALVSYVASEEASFVTAFTFDATGGRATY